MAKKETEKEKLPLDELSAIDIIKMNAWKKTKQNGIYINDGKI